MRRKTIPLPPWEGWADPRINDYVAEHMAPWIGARYMPGASKRDYTDCVGFIVGLGSDLENTPVSRKRLPQDLAFHDRKGAIEGMKKVMRSFPSWEKLVGVPASLRPGDVLAVGPKNGGPGHGIFVSPWPNQLAQATQLAGVHLSPMMLFAEHQELFAIYRHTEPEKWIS